MTLKANTHVEKASKGGFNNNVWVNQLAKGFKIDKSVNRLKPVVAFSVLTSGTQLFPFTKRAATPAVPLGDCYMLIDIPIKQLHQLGFPELVLAASQTIGEAGMKWFEGTTDVVRQFTWVFEDAKNRNIENILILYRDHLYRMNYMDFVQQHPIDNNADFTISCAIVGEKSIESLVVLQPCIRLWTAEDRRQGPSFPLH
ncbi:hypothetical protein OIU77_027973 [Salix suchowensis]|uniref:Nucleotidyl transferase domain-containing protein n=1 Tax=Salix suchowensis TaxID=1278906 RepID=A0ABQ9BRH2_9ROSI|nr:hypothetical protein OIU77_027973 [Salix suchowensis]